MIAVSTICYLHGKILGLTQSQQVLQALVQGKEVRGVPRPKAIDTIQKVGDLFGDLDQIAIRIEPNGSSLGKARARALAWAHGSGADVWVSCDDDVTASPGTLQTMVRLCREAAEPRVIVAPCALRAEGNHQEASVNVLPVKDALPVEHGLLLPLWRGGFGLVAMNRFALQAIHDVRPTCRDDDGNSMPLVFNCEVLTGRDGAEWLGEDFSFFEQVRQDVRCYALLRGETDHAGAVIDLGDVARLFVPQSGSSSSSGSEP